VLAVMALLLASCALGDDGPPIVDEAFYRQTFPMTAGEQGRLLDSQTPDGVPDGYRGWRILYQSVDVLGQPAVVSGMVLRPDRDAPVGGWPIVGFAHGTTGIADGCAPSRDPSALALVQNIVDDGYAVVETDYVGLGTAGVHPYLDGNSEGRAVLDSLRAARQITALRAGSTAAIWGYSQGGHSALFAGQLAVTEGADLGIVGVVDQAGPSRTDFALGGRSISSRYEFFLLTSVASSATRLGLRLDSIIGPGGVAAAPEIIADGSTVCPNFGAIARAVPVGERVSDPVAAHPEWEVAFAALDLSSAPAVAPVFIQHGTADEIVPFAESVIARARLCSAGTSVTFHPQANGVHLTAIDPIPPLSWLADIRRGTTPRNDCRR